MLLKDLVEALNSGLVKVGLRTGSTVTLSGTSDVRVTNAPHVAVDSLPSLIAGAATIGNVGLVAGAASIGSVNVGTMPTVTVNPHALTAGAAAIGTVGVTTLPALPTGSNTVGKVDVNQMAAAAAAADAVANPTEGRVGADNSVFNGTSWDRARGAGLLSATGDSGTKTTNGSTAIITNNVGNKGMMVVFTIGAVSGATPTLQFKLQGSIDGGANHLEIPGAVSQSITASGVYGMLIYPALPAVAGSGPGTMASVNAALPRTWRFAWYVGGTSPSFAITSIQYQYLPN